MLQAAQSLSPVDNVTHLQADIDIPVPDELSGTEMDPYGDVQIENIQ